MTRMWKFVGTCASIVEDEVPFLHSMTEAEKSSDYETFDRALSYDNTDLSLASWARSVGYDKDLALSDDWHVSYHESFWNGRKCLYLRWSGFEVIWVVERYL